MIKLDTSGKRIYYSLNYDCTEAFVEKLQQLLSRKKNRAEQTLHRNGELNEQNEYFFQQNHCFYRCGMQPCLRMHEQRCAGNSPAEKYSANHAGTRPD